MYIGYATFAIASQALRLVLALIKSLFYGPTPYTGQLDLYGLSYLSGPYGPSYYFGPYESMFYVTPTVLLAIVNKLSTGPNNTAPLIVLSSF